MEQSGVWPQSTPAAESVDEGALLVLDAAIDAGKHGYIDSLLVIRHGKVIFERRYPREYGVINAPYAAPSHQYNYRDEHWHPWYKGNTELHTMQSVTKSVLEVLYGIALQQGKLASVDVSAFAMLGERNFADSDGRKAAITLRDLLTMRSGLA